MRRLGLAVLTIVLCGTCSSAGAQTSYSKVLVGKWEGRAHFPASRDNPNRTLIIESVGAGDGPLTVKGKYGITGQGMGPMNGTLETADGKAKLRFTSLNSHVVLELEGDKDLVGTLAILGGLPRDMRLKKVE